jgi:hypothetical protein
MRIALLFALLLLGCAPPPPYPAGWPTELRLPANAGDVSFSRPNPRTIEARFALRGIPIAVLDRIDADLRAASWTRTEDKARDNIMQRSYSSGDGLRTIRLESTIRRRTVQTRRGRIDTTADYVVRVTGSTAAPAP